MALQSRSTEDSGEQIPGQRNQVREADTHFEETVESQQAFSSAYARPASRPISLLPERGSPPAPIAPRSSYNLSPIPDEQELQVSSRRHSVIAPRETVQDGSVITETRRTTVKEREAFNKLEQAGRRWFLATLSNRFVEEPLQEAMPNISQDGPIYREGKRRLRTNYKSWKHRTLKDSLEWMRTWLSRPENSKYKATANFACLRMAVSKSYDASSDIKAVFAWAQEAINFEKCSDRGHAWISCTRHQHSRFSSLRY